MTAQRASVVDAHAHAMPTWVITAFRDWLAESGTMAEGPPMLWQHPAFDDPGRQVESLDRAGISSAILTYTSCAPAALHSAAVSSSPRLTGPLTISRVNSEVRTWRQQTGGRLLPTCWVDPRLTDSALAEIDRAVSDGGARAISLLTSYQDTNGRLRFLDDPAFEPVLAAAAGSGVTVFVHAAAQYPLTAPIAHPLGPTETACLTGGLGMLVETTLCISRLVLAGSFDRHPTLNMVFGQLGGVLPFVLGRFDLIQQLIGRQAAAVNAKPILRRLRDYAGQIFVDTHSMDSNALTCALDVLGPDRILFGSDFPVTPEAAGRFDALAMVQAIAGENSTAMLAGNALSLLALSEEAAA